MLILSDMKEIDTYLIMGCLGGRAPTGLIFLLQESVFSFKFLIYMFLFGINCIVNQSMRLILKCLEYVFDIGLIYII
jgi:hypothetical protein